MLKFTLIPVFFLISVIYFYNTKSIKQFYVIKLDIKNHVFEPREIRAKAGQAIKLIINNLDNTTEEFESIELNREKIIPAGKSINIVLAPQKPGKYHFFGDFHADTANGYLLIE